MRTETRSNSSMAPTPAPPNRPLPAQINPLMTEDIPPYESLVARRRLGQTDLSVKAGQVGTSNSTKPKNLGTFDYAHLRAPLPKGIFSGIFKPSPASYFLMRRSSDGYISATGMFKASFPYAEAAEEETERRYIKSLPSTSTDETAGNVWIPPTHALELASEYNILPWIKALLDNAPIEVNTMKDATPKSISTPPRFPADSAAALTNGPVLLPQEQLTAAPTPTPARGRPRREASPSKIASPRKIASTRTRKAKAGSVEPKTLSKLEPAVEAPPAPAIESVVEAIVKEAVDAADAVDAIDAAPVIPETKEEPVVTVRVDQDVEINGDIETTHTHVKVEMPAGSPDLPLPEDTEAMIAKAKEMVDAAVEDRSSLAGPSNGKKRKADEVEEDEADAVVVEPKKVKVEADLRREKIKTRALIGISATLAVGAIIPYVLNAF